VSHLPRAVVVAGALALSLLALLSGGSRPTSTPPGAGELLASLRLLAVAAVRPAVQPADADEPPSPSGHARTVRYDPPVDAPVVDEFRPPATDFGPGNRGLDYATVPGTPVRAVGDGTVTFAGRIGADWYVTVLHADGLRSSLSFLRSVEVRRGETVRRGQRVGTASARIQIGFRDESDRYLDPAPLLARRSARLVPPPRADPWEPPG